MSLFFQRGLRAGILLALCAGAAPAATLQVGSGKPYPKPCAAIAAAADGDTIEIDAATYKGDVCTISKNNLLIRGVGGRAVIDAASKSDHDKAAWVAAGDDLIVENIEFRNAYSTAMNGAGIRAEGTNLTIRNCRFINNQMGLLSIAYNPASEILIEYSEFGPSHRQDGGLAHNIYINHVGRFTMRHSYSHHSSVGQLVKSRARETRLFYNRFSSEATGTTSYEVSIPNGGLTYIVGNVIEQGPKQQNTILLTYLEEGASAYNPDNRLFVVNNTFVNDYAAWGMFVKIAAAAKPATIVNNIFVGTGSVTSQTTATLAGNVIMPTEVFFANPGGYDYDLLPGSPAVDAGVTPPVDNGFSLAPDAEYVHKGCGQKRSVQGKYDAGAYEWNGGVSNAGCMVSPPVLLAKPVLSSATVPGGSSTTHRVNLNGPAPAGGVLVMLDSSAPSVEQIPVSVLVPQNAISESFVANAAPVATATPVTVTTQYGQSGASSSLTVVPSTAPVLSSIALSATTYQPNQTATNNVVTLSGPAPSGGATVILKNSNPTLATVPVSLTIPAGASSAAFPLITGATAGTFTITATYVSISKSDSATISVPSTAAVLSGLTLVGSSFGANLTVSGSKVLLSAAAPSGGAVVALTSSNKSVATVPASVTVPAGQTSVTFSVKTLAQGGTFTVNATYGGVRKTATATVAVSPSTAKPAIQAIILASKSIKAGTAVFSSSVKLSAAAPSGGAVVTLTSSTGAITLPPSVTVPAGATSAAFTLVTAQVTAITPFSITATYSGTVSVNGSVTP